MLRILFLLAGLGASLGLDAQSLAPRLQPRLQHLMDSIREAQAYPGLTLAIVLDDGSRLKLASGLADKEESIPMSAGSMMPAGSTGKTFVAALALREIFALDLDLDTPIRQWLKEETWFEKLPNGPDITLRMLMSHRSGLPRYVFDEGFLGALQEEPDRVWAVEDELTFILDKPPLHPAGEGWAYSDTNYLILGLLLEKWTGRAYYELLQEKIIEPYSLTHTRPWDRPEQPGLTPGYVGDMNPLNLPAKVGEQERYPVNPQFEWCGGGLISNAPDLAYWMWILHRGDVMSPEAYQAMIQPFDLRTGAPGETGYGLGTFVWPTLQGLHYGHAGFFPGYTTQIEYNRDHGFSIALQVNTDQGAGRYLHAHVLAASAIIREALVELDQEAAAGIRKNLQFQADCWNAGDIRCYMNAYHVTDSLRMVSRSGVKQGYEDILQRYLETYPPDKMGQLHFNLLHLTRLRNDLYLVIGRYNLDRADGPLSGYFSALMQHIDGTWKMISDHSS